MSTSRLSERIDIKLADGFSYRAIRVAFYVSSLVLWSLLAISFERIPRPDEVVSSLYQEFLRGEVFSNFYVTLVRFGVAVVIASVVGLVVGLAIGLSRLWQAFLEDTVLVGLSMPGMIWAFLTVMWFGVGWQAPTFGAALAATPFLAVNVSKGVRSVSRDLQDMSDAFEVSQWRRIRHLFLPAIAGYLAAGLRIGVIIGWNAALLSEWFGGSNGAGFRARYWYDGRQVDGFAAWIILFVVFIIALDRIIFDPIARRALAWRDG